MQLNLQFAEFLVLKNTVNWVLYKSHDWLLKLWEPAYNIFVLQFHPKKQQFSVAYQSPRELFKGSNGPASLLDCRRKTFFWLGMQVFMSDVISEVVLGSFWHMLPGLGPNR